MAADTALKLVLLGEDRSASKALKGSAGRPRRPMASSTG